MIASRLSFSGSIFFCFSNNAKVRFKPPKFKKTKFTLDGDGVTQTLRMKY